MAGPVISSIVYTVTDTTISVTYTTDAASSSNIFVTGGGVTARPGVDNGYAANSTSNRAIVTGLKPNTVYSCTVSSTSAGGTTTSSPQNVTTSPLQNRIPVLSAATGIPIKIANTGGGDSIYSFQSSDGITYVTMNDSFGLTGTANAGANIQICKFTNNATLAGADVNRITSYTPGGSGVNQTSGTDGPSGQAMRAAAAGPYSINGNLFMFVWRNNQGGPPPASWYGNVIMDHADHGATWNKFTVPGTWNANGVGPCDGTTNADIHQYAQTYYGAAVPILYAADDGTLGYNTAGNQIDGANAFVYVTFRNDSDGTTLYLIRWPRIYFAAQDNSQIQYWKGPGSPTPADFVNDSNWSTSDSTLTSIHTTIQSRQGGRVAFIPGINRYVLTEDFQTGVGNTDFYFSEAPTPAGPWTQFFTQSNVPSGWIGPAFMHADVVANTATDNISLRLLYAGAFNVPNYYQGRASALVLRTTTQPTAAWVQGNSTSTGQSGTTATLAFSGNVTSGHLIVIVGRTTVTLASLSDNLGDAVSWNTVYSTADSGGTFGFWAWKFAGATAACTVTAHFGSSAAGVVLAVGEWSGVNALRHAPAAGITSSNTVASSATSSCSQNDLVIGLFESDAGGVTPLAAGDGFTLREQGTVSTSSYVVIEDMVVSAASASLIAKANGWTGAGHVTGGIGVFYNNTFTPGEYAISGSAGVAGATVSYSGVATGSVIADGSNNYSIPNLFPGAYMVTPSLTGYSFSPTSASETITNANITGVNFTASSSVAVGNAGSARLRRRKRLDAI